MFSNKLNQIILFVIVFSLIMVSFTLIIAFVVLKYQKKKMIYDKGVEELKSKHENNLLKAQLQVQEQTFQNISREIHDNIGQKLTLAKLQLNTLMYNDLDYLKKNIFNIVQIVSESLNDLRDISRSLSSDMITNNGLLKALEHEIHQLNKTFVYNIKLSITGEAIFMNADRELVIYRIIQEVLNNIMKHAEATQVNIDFYYSNTNLEIEVMDNGKGFDIHEVNMGNGIHNIITRAASIAGATHFESKFNSGTKVHIKIPYHEKGKV